MTGNGRSFAFLLCMSQQEELSPLRTSATTAKVSIVSLFFAAAVSLLTSLIGAFGLIIFMGHSGKLTFAGVRYAAFQNGGVTETSKTRQIIFEPMLVNLADADGQGYLRFTVVLKVIDEEQKVKDGKVGEKKGISSDDPGVRDAILRVAVSETSGELLNNPGKEAFKSKMRAAILQRAPEMKIADILFTDFLVQH